MHTSFQAVSFQSQSKALTFQSQLTLDQTENIKDTNVNGNDWLATLHMLLQLPSKFSDTEISI